MKRILLLIVIIYTLLPCIVFAGDTDMWIKGGDQDAFIIGKVTSEEEGLYSIHVEKVLMGMVEGEDILVESQEKKKYIGLEVGNYVVASLDKKNENYIIKHGVYRVDSTDFKTLKLDYASYNNINERIQKFINSGSFVEADRNAKNRKDNDINAISSNTVSNSKSSYTVWFIVIVATTISCFCIFNQSKKKR